MKKIIIIFALVLSLLFLLSLPKANAQINLNFQNETRSQKFILSIYFRKLETKLEKLLKRKGWDFPNEINFEIVDEGISSMFVYPNEKNKIYVKKKFFTNKFYLSREELLSHEIGHLIDFNNENDKKVLQIKKNYDKIKITQYGEASREEYFAEFISKILN